VTRAPLVDLAATIACAHGGSATPTAVAGRIVLGGAPAITIDTPLAVAGCTLPPAAGGPCRGGAWQTGTTRVMASGRPLATAGSASVCVPTGTPLTVVATQTRVAAR
jgi:hypothetical protein